MAFLWRPLLLILGIGLLAGLLAALFGSHLFWPVCSVGLLLYLLLHLRQLARLAHWLGQADIAPPALQGVWEDIAYPLEKRLRAQQRATDKYAADLDQMLEATRSLPDGVVILDQDNRILWVNDAAQHQLGLTPKSDIGQFVLYLLRISRFSEWLLAEDAARTLTLESPVAAGRTLSLQIVPLPRKQKMLVARDISEIARVEAMRRDFIANVSHELRTPVTVILGFLEAFEDMPNTEPGDFRKHIPLMREQSERIRRLVDDLLVLARLESEPDAKDETVDLPALAKRLAGEAETLSQGRHRITLALDSRARLIGNSQEIYSALANLVTNAVRYTPTGGQISLRWHVNGSGWASFSVTDTGEGIEAQHIPRLTERFYRVDRGRSRASGGTGLGLAIVKHVLHRHQAHLKIESSVGKGSTFTAQFPAERVIPASEHPEPLSGTRTA